MKAVIYNFTFWTDETDPIKLKRFYRRALGQAGFTVKAFRQVHFKPQGYSAVWVLAESHFAVHTFPEAGKTYCELSSCNKAMYNKFKKWITELPKGSKFANI